MENESVVRSEQVSERVDTTTPESPGKKKRGRKPKNGVSKSDEFQIENIINLKKDYEVHRGRGLELECPSIPDETNIFELCRSLACSETNNEKPSIDGLLINPPWDTWGKEATTKNGRI